MVFVTSRIRTSRRWQLDLAMSFDCGPSTSADISVCTGTFAWLIAWVGRQQACMRLLSEPESHSHVAKLKLGDNGDSFRPPFCSRPHRESQNRSGPQEYCESNNSTQRGNKKSAFLLATVWRRAFRTETSRLPGIYTKCPLSTTGYVELRLKRRWFERLFPAR